MRISIIIPAHNEEEYIGDCITSFISQTRPPDELIIVNDNSTDKTLAIISEFSRKYTWIKVFSKESNDLHLPGKKVIEAFNYGFEQVSNFDLIGKFDADIILPNNYFEILASQFKNEPRLGMCSGLLYIKKDNKWIFENIANKEHIRGPIKLYSKKCFEAIKGLKNSLGWDTVDVLLAQYYGFTIKTERALKVKHLRPTGHGYSTKNYSEKGKVVYKMNYDFLLAKIALSKMAWQIKSPALFFNGMVGYLKSWISKEDKMVSLEEGKFIRRLRWKGIKQKIF